MTRENIDDDELLRTEQAGAAAVRVASLVAAGDDGIEREAAGFETGDLDGEAHALGGEGGAVEEELAAGDFGTLEE